MGFTDGELKKLKEGISGPDAPPSAPKFLALIARLEAAEDLNAKRRKHDEFDCPHDAEDQCKCGSLERQLWKEYEESEEVWRRAAGK